MYKQCPSYDIKIILDDMNAKEEWEIWIERAVGICGLHDESNDIGTRLINYAVHLIMFIGEHYWEDIIKMDLQEVGFGVVNWMELAEDMDRWRALMNAIMNLRVP